jgi:glycosyltransferase involved in cell wall biosynthesis
MKMVYDARWLPLDGKFDGVGRYSQELGRALAARSDVDVTWLIHDEQQLSLLPDKPYIIGNKPDDLWAELRSLPARIETAQPDVVYAPFFLTALARGNYKLVVTIHDTIYYHYRTPPHWLPWFARLCWRLFHLSKAPMRWLLNRADAVATVSDTAKQEILAWELTKRPVVAVKNAVSDKFQADTSSVASLSRAKSTIIVHHGAVTQYKNVELIIDALPLVPDVQLHILGRVPAARMRDLVRRIDDRGVIDRVMIHNGVTDKELVDMLGHCRCLISPSRIEGFGLPIIEAQLRGAPVICADTPIYHEVGGDSVLYVGVDDAEGCARAINELADPAMSTRLVEAGLQNAARFNWSASAEQAHNICRRIIVPRQQS